MVLACFPECNVRSTYILQQLSFKETDQILTENAVFVSLNNNNNDNTLYLMSKQDRRFIGRLVGVMFVMATPWKYIENCRLIKYLYV